MVSLAWAVLGGSVAYQVTERRWSPWLSGIAALALASGNGWTILLVAAAGVSGFRFQRARAAEARADARRLEAEMFLRRLRHQVQANGSIAMALAAVGVRGGYRYGDGASEVLRRAAEEYHAPAIAETAFVLAEAERHGGSVDAVLGDVLSELQRERRRLHGVRAEEEGSRTTAVVLAGVPVVALIVLDVTAHPLYRELVGTATGHAGLAWIAATTVATMEVLIRHMERATRDTR